MSNKTISFFSSDSRPLYKADVFRALALPKGYVLHFRYRRKYIQQELGGDILKLENREGVIFYVRGNPLQQPNEGQQEQSNILTPKEYISIRKVPIEQVYHDAYTDTFHFFLQLKDFADTQHHTNTPPTLLPVGGVFVSELMLLEGPNNLWIHRVNAVEKDFPGVLFYNVNGLKDHSKELGLTQKLRRDWLTPSADSHRAAVA